MKYRYRPFTSIAMLRYIEYRTDTTSGLVVGEVKFQGKPLRNTLLAP